MSFAGIDKLALSDGQIEKVDLRDVVVGAGNRHVLFGGGDELLRIERNNALRSEERRVGKECRL